MNVQNTRASLTFMAIFLMGAYPRFVLGIPLSLSLNSVLKSLICIGNFLFFWLINL